MGDEQRAESEALFEPHHLIAHEHEQQAKGNTGDDIGVRHRDIGQTHNRLAQLGSEVVDTHGRHRAKHRCDDGGKGRHQQGVAQQAQQLIVLEQTHILLQGEAFKLGQILARVERSHDEHHHRDVQEHEHQDRKELIGLFHTITPPSSSPPSLFIMPVQTNTSSISTRLRAAPRLGLLPCLKRRSMTSPMRMVSVPPSF